MVAFKRRNDANGNKNGWNDEGKISKETLDDRGNNGEDAREKVIEGNSN